MELNIVRFSDLEPFVLKALQRSLENYGGLDELSKKVSINNTFLGMVLEGMTLNNAEAVITLAVMLATLYHQKEALEAKAEEGSLNDKG